MEHPLESTAALPEGARRRQGARVGVALLLLCLPGIPACEEPEPFTLAVLPDTQGYRDVPEIYQAQTAWLAANRDALGIELAVHTGDLVEGTWVADEWERARAAMAELDGKLPYVIAPGNHDYGATYESRNSRDRSTLLHSYFPRDLFEAMPTFGGFSENGDRVDNSYHVFFAGGEYWLVMALEFGPRDTTLAWARDVLAAHPDHRAIIATHAYLYADDTRYDWASKGDAQQWNPHSYGIGQSAEGVNDGEEMWTELIRDSGNVVAVLCGHVLLDGLGYQVSQGASVVHEMLSNYQMNESGGEGYLRLLRFDPDSRQVQVTTYSPWTDTYKTDPANEFSFAY